MTLAALVAASLTGIALPHVLRLRRADPAAACALWGAGLGLRALVVVGAVCGALVFLHPAHLFAAVAEWGCAPTHRVAGHAAAAFGGLALSLSLLYALARVAQAAVAVRGLVRHPLGAGPEGSLIVGGDGVVLAAAGLVRPRLLVSAGALTQLDDAELRVAIAHEQAHIRRGHRWALLFAEICRVLGRPLPGTLHAVRELRLHIERDADRTAVRGRPERLALASAIVKAASVSAVPSGVALLAGDDTVARVRELLDADDLSRSARLATRTAALAVVLVAVVAALVLPGELGALGEPVTLCS
ncbi:MAG: M56 family metallopeptidase [Solirubrobacteraceae bacterium]